MKLGFQGERPEIRHVDQCQNRRFSRTEGGEFSKPTDIPVDVFPAERINNRFREWKPSLVQLADPAGDDKDNLVVDGYHRKIDAKP